MFEGVLFALACAKWAARVPLPDLSSSVVCDGSEQDCFLVSIPFASYGGRVLRLGWGAAASQSCSQQAASLPLFWYGVVAN